MKEYRGMPYTSREAKLARERYILVAAIVTDIIQGVWNICVVKRCKRLNATRRKQGHTRLRGTGSITGIEFNQHPETWIGENEKLQFKFNIMNTCGVK
jgi:hypothetical protein